MDLFKFYLYIVTNVFIEKQVLGTLDSHLRILQLCLDVLCEDLLLF